MNALASLIFREIQASGKIFSSALPLFIGLISFFKPLPNLTFKIVLQLLLSIDLPL